MTEKEPACMAVDSAGHEAIAGTSVSEWGRSGFKLEANRAMSATKRPRREMVIRIDDVAIRCFRNVADADYIAARMAHRGGLMPQFLWSSLQAFEKYLKYILLVNRVPAKDINHDIKEAWARASMTPYPPRMTAGATEFLNHAAKYGANRYLEWPYHVEGYALMGLDMTVWQLRRFCQVFHAVRWTPNKAEQLAFANRRQLVEQSEAGNRRAFRTTGGFLETVLDTKDHPARPALVWQNGFYSTSRRKKVAHRNSMAVSNSPLNLYPYMLDELLSLMVVEGKTEWREYLAAAMGDPSKSS